MSGTGINRVVHARIRHRIAKPKFRYPSSDPDKDRICSNQNPMYRVVALRFSVTDLKALPDPVLRVAKRPTMHKYTLSESKDRKIQVASAHNQETMRSVCFCIMCRVVGDALPSVKCGRRSYSFSAPAVIITDVC